MNINQSLAPKELHHLTVKISNNYICEIDRTATVVKIPREAIVKIESKYGTSTERPLALILFGIILSLTGLLPVNIIYDWLIHGGTLHDVQVLMLLLFPLGLYLIVDTLSSKYFLWITTEKDKRKIVFNGKTTKKELDSFLKNAEDVFGYKFVES